MESSHDLAVPYGPRRDRAGCLPIGCIVKFAFHGFPSWGASGPPSHTKRGIRDEHRWNSGAALDCDGLGMVPRIQQAEQPPILPRGSVTVILCDELMSRQKLSFLRLVVESWAYMMAWHPRCKVRREVLRRWCIQDRAGSAVRTRAVRWCVARHLEGRLPLARTAPNFPPCNSLGRLVCKADVTSSVPKPSTYCCSAPTVGLRGGCEEHPAVGDLPV